MHISPRGLALIREFEGFSAEPYLCSGGKMTIGYGHVLTADESAMLEKITKEHAEALLIQDVAIAEHAVRRLVKTTLAQNQFDALVSFVYNVGAGAFEKSTLLRLVNARDFNAAANQLTRWVYASGKKLNGLMRRRMAEKAMFLHGFNI